MVADGLRSSDRVRALRDLGEALWRQQRQVSPLAGRGAELLAAAVDRLPIRDAGALRARYGGDAERTAEQLVDEAARLAGWLWTAAAAIPAPARAVHAITVVTHSAVEIRLIAELYAVYDLGAAARDPARLGAVVGAWAAGRPVPVGLPVVSGTREIVGKLRQAHTGLADRGGRERRVGPAAVDARPARAGRRRDRPGGAGRIPAPPADRLAGTPAQRPRLRRRRQGEGCRGPRRVVGAGRRLPPDLDAVAAGQPAPTGLDDKLGKDANRIDERCTIGGATD